MREIPEGHYGDATSAIRQILELADAIDWFPRSWMPDLESRAVELATEHLARARRVAATQVSPDLQPSFVHGDWRVLDRYFDAAWRDRSGFEPPNDWGIGQVLSNLKQAAEKSDDLASLIGPPLWPVPGQLSVVSALVADERVLDALEVGSYRDVVWTLICQVEVDLWNALAWSLVHQGDLAKNPFVPILELYRIGVYPLGIRGKQFVLFRYAT